MLAIPFQHDAGRFLVRLVRYGPNHHMPLHAHDELGVSVVLDGALVEEADHHSVSPTAGWTVVKPAGTYHANRFGPAGATMLAVVFRDSSDSAAHFPLPWRWLDRPAPYRAALRLLRAVRRGTARDREDTVTELVAALGPFSVSSRELPWLRSVRSALDELAPGESVSALAARAGVHPVYLARRFRAAFGMSLREYRRMAQVRRATQLIVGTRRSLSEIAHRCGFSDHSHMCRAFRSVAGVNPAALRAS